MCQTIGLGVERAIIQCGVRRYERSREWLERGVAFEQCDNAALRQWRARHIEALNQLIALLRREYVERCHRRFGLSPCVLEESHKTLRKQKCARWSEDFGAIFQRTD